MMGSTSRSNTVLVLSPAISIAVPVEHANPDSERQHRVQITNATKATLMRQTQMEKPFYMLNRY